MRSKLSQIKQWIVSILAGFMFHTGILKRLVDQKLGGKTIVLTYHRILPENVSKLSFSTSSIVVHPETFEMQMRFLKENFDIIPIHDLDQKTKVSDSKRKPRVVITFDDGWVDNYLYALPILNLLKIPATIYLPIDFIGTNQLFWQERIARKIYLLSEMNEAPAIELLKHLKLATLNTLSADARKEVILELISQLKEKNYDSLEQFEKLISAIVTFDPSSQHIDRYVNWDQVREMASFGIDFGSHCCSHRILTRLKPQIVEEEMIRSAKVIEAETGIQQYSIAYPNGSNDEQVRTLARDTGYQLGFGTQKGLVENNDDRFNIRRINVNQRITSNLPRFLLSLLPI